MALYRNQFKVHAPGLSALTRRSAPVTNVDTLIKDPLTALKDGELVQYDGLGNFKRGDTTTTVAYHVISDYGDTGLQASRKVDAIVVGSYICTTEIYDDTSLVVGSPLQLLASIDIGDGQGAIRTGVSLNDLTGGKVVVGYVTKLPANNGGRLEFHRVGL